MTILPGPSPLPSSSIANSYPQEAAANFGQLVQRIVQSNSGKHRALVTPAPRKEREDTWAEFRTMAERAQASGNFAHAEAMWLKAIADTHSFDDRDWRRAYSFDCLAALCYAQERFDEAEVFAMRALEATRLSYGEDHLKTAECEMFVASICFCLSKTEDAIAYAKNALALYEQLLEPVHAKIATACFNLAVIYHSFGSFDQAEEFYQRAFKLRAHIFGWDHDMTTRISKSYAEMAVDRKYHLEAKEILDRLIGPVPESQ